MISKVIAYTMPPKSIVVGIPFTWGARNFWAIKIEDGDIYRLGDGRLVEVPEEEILCDEIVYANSIEIKYVG